MFGRIHDWADAVTERRSLLVQLAASDVVTTGNGDGTYTHTIVPKEDVPAGLKGS